MNGLGHFAEGERKLRQAVEARLDAQFSQSLNEAGRVRKLAEGQALSAEAAAHFAAASASAALVGPYRDPVTQGEPVRDPAQRLPEQEQTADGWGGR